MAQDISGFGLRVSLIASNTMPNGADISAFADDADPFDIPELTIAETAMGLNGDLVTFSSANPVAVTISLIPGSDDDVNLQTIAEANRVGLDKSSVRDVIALVGVYPDGRTVRLTGGKLVNYRPGNSVASAGRFKSKPYSFMFENISVT